MPYDQLLLIVLLPKHGDIGLHNGKEAGHHRSNAVEVPGSQCAAKILGQPGYGHHRRHIEAEWVHGLHVRRENHVGGRVFQATRIAVERARVFVEILAFPELRRIDKDTYDHAFRMLAPQTHQ